MSGLPVTWTLLGPGASKFTQMGWFSVKDYGAVGDGVTDDSAAILACHAAAAAALSAVFYPPAKYAYKSATPITITTESGIFSFGAKIIGSGPVTDCFYFNNPANSNFAGIYYLPSVSNFGECGIRIYGSLATVYADDVSSCGTSLRLEGNGNIPINCLDNTVTINSMFSSNYGVDLNAINRNVIFQGNIVNVNFVDGCEAALYFRDGGGVPTGANPYNTATNIFNLYAIDGTAAPGSVAVKCDAAIVPFGTILNCPAFFGGFNATPWVSWNGGFQNIITTAGGGAGSTPVAWAAYVLANTLYFGNVGNAVITATVSQGNYPYIAQTAQNNRTAFESANGFAAGKGPPNNTFVVNCVLPNPLTNGQQFAFYVYSPYTSGDQNLVSGNLISGAPIALCINDNSTTNANEIRIVLTAIGNLAAGTYQVSLKVGCR